MKDSRSASQILFGLLPQQTIDARGGIWKVRYWRTKTVHDVDVDELRRELERVARPWEEAGTDGGFVASLRGGREIRVESLDRQDGVTVEAFPKTWRCKTCGRLHKSPGTKCECGSRGRHGQLPFVLFHDACGDVRDPYYATCPEHGQVRMHLPGTTNLSEIRLSCPVCNRELPKHFEYTRCQCGIQGNRSERGPMMEFAIHRAASVFTPRTIVVVNPPSKTQMRRLIQSGGPRAALTWLNEGMHARWVDQVEGAKAAALRRDLMERGLSSEVVDSMMDQSGLVDGPAMQISASTTTIEKAENEAAALALAMSETRQTVDDLASNAIPNLRDKYTKTYPSALRHAGLDRVDLVEKFPVLTGQFGYTRGDQEPGNARLRAFTRKDGTFVVYGDRASTEALVSRLDPVAVVSWLTARGHSIEPQARQERAFEAILRSFGADLDACPIFSDLTVLIHSMSHRVVRHASFFAGIDRNALSELLFPSALAFATYAVPRGDFVLGGLQALFEHDLDMLFDRVVHDESRCALDPGCSSSPNGAACAVCLHLGEPSCRLFNTKLDRHALFDEHKGYFKICAGL